MTEIQRCDGPGCSVERTIGGVEDRRLCEPPGWWQITMPGGLTYDFHTTACMNAWTDGRGVPATVTGL